MRIGDRVQLKDPTNFPVTHHGKEGDPNGSVEVRTFTVKVRNLNTLLFSLRRLSWATGNHNIRPRHLAR